MQSYEEYITYIEGFTTDMYLIAAYISSEKERKELA